MPTALNRALLEGRLDVSAMSSIAYARNADRLGNYNALDLRINRTYALSRGALDVFLEVTNLLSRENECCIEYSITRSPDGAPVLDEEVDHWLRLVPSIGVLWRY